MSSDREVQRLTEVYEGYASDTRAARRHSATNTGNQMIVQERWRVIASMLEASGQIPLTQCTILDVGAGTGGDLPKLIALGADPASYHGIDLMPSRIERARQLYPDVDFRVCNAEKVGFADCTFDLVLLSTVVSSVLDLTMKQAIAREVTRVLKPGGAVLWYDMRYPSPGNRNVRQVTRREIRTLFPSLSARLKSATVVPPVARRLAWATGTLYPVLAAVPLLRTHLVGLLVKDSA